MNSRVLFLPHNLRHTYYHSLLSTASSHGWEIIVVAPENQRRTWANISKPPNGFIITPDFSVRAEWETDVDELRRVDDVISDSEIKTDNPIGRIILAGERDIGRAFGREFYYWPSNRLMSSALAETEGPGRVLRRIFKFSADILDEISPDVVLAGIVGSPLDSVMSMVAAARQIPFVMNRTSKVASRFCFWTTDRLMRNSAARKKYAQFISTGARASDTALKQIEIFRNAPKTVDYIERNWQRGAARNWLTAHRGFADRAAAHVAHILKRRQGAPPKPVLPAVAEYYRVAYLQHRQERLYSALTPKELGGLRYIYFPLHKEPEIAINYQAPVWHNQKNTIALLSAHLPYGYRLLVREHRFNMGRRPTKYLKALSAYPGVTLIHPLDSQFKYIQNANLIVTDNGSSGWEGLLLRRPVLTLADSFYEPTGLSHRLTDSARLGNDILGLLQDGGAKSGNDYDNQLGLLFDAEWATTVPDDDTQHELSLKLIVEISGLGVARLEQEAV